MLLSPGNQHDIVCAKLVVGSCRPKSVAGDKAYDSDDFRRWLRARRIRPVIPGKSNRLRKIRHSRPLYRDRHKVENFFCRIKSFTSIAFRFEKNDETFLAMVQLAMIKDWLR